ncbi:MAG: hypothetical protein KJO47_08315, partial [Gammaproteobacteria bacterium]|nr:hypothetical protein [Gammaproteobacteria bacterium]
IENITVIFLLTAIITCLLFLFAKEKIKFVSLKVWVVLFLLGSIYYAGEEISWGQHFFGWSTPEQWTEFNDQQETNLHNTAAIFDQIPRTLLSIAALIGGVLIPIFRKYKNHIPNKESFFDWLLPTYVCLPAALLSLLVSWHEKMYKILDMRIPEALDIRAGETKECLLALFMMMYALSIWYRNRNVIGE